MSVLFVMPRWEDAFGGWMKRMMDGIAEDLVAVAVNDSLNARRTPSGIQAISLRPPAREFRYISRIFGMAGLLLEKAEPDPEDSLRKVIHQLSVTHILCQYGTFAVRFMNVWRETDIPLFIHFHGYDATFDLRVPDQPDKRFFSNDYLLNIKELEQRAVFIVNSEFTKSLLMEAGISPDRMILKYLGAPIPEEQRLHCYKEKVQILHLGRLVDFKSPDRTIQAFELAMSRGLNGNLVLAGDGPLRASCELLKHRSPYRDSIHILGEVGVPDVQTLISASDIFTAHNITGEITRQTECLGVSILEAMAGGLPVVGTRSGGVNETVVDGQTGILTQPGDVDAQADAFLRLAKDPDLRQKMGDAGRARISTLFTIQQEAAQLRRIMNLPVRPS